MRRTRALAVALVASAAACTPFDLDPPDRIGVVLEGPAGSTVRLVTSTHFETDPTRNPDEGAVELVNADTALVELPFQRDYDVVEREERPSPG